MKMVNITIDGKTYTVPSDYTVLKAATENGIYIPRLCFLEGIHEASSCRICVVEIEGQRTLKNSCTFQVFEGMVVKTDTPMIRSSIVTNLELLAANHRFECWKCERERNCEFLDLLRKYEIENVMGESNKYSKKERIINESVAMKLDSGKCILCGRCISVCQKVAATSVLSFNQRGSKTVVGPAQLVNMEDSGCIYCGKCIQACPVAAITEKSEINEVRKEIKDPNKFVVVQAAPAVRAALGEEFGMEIGINVEGKMYTAFNMLGFDEIADVNFAADLTILEEGTEFIERLNGKDKVLPMFTSCSPGWIRYIEQYQPEYLDNLSSCKSPHQMGGAIIKHYLANKLGINKENVVVVSIMPCIAKKYESNRPEMEVDGLRDVDYVLTTRELARMIRLSGIDFANLKESKPEGEMAKFTGAGAIFGVTGGVMEAALRTVKEVLENKELDKLNFTEVRGFNGIKEATLNIAGKDINIAVVHGGKAIKDFFKILKSGEKEYHFVEFMGCVGGCINGGGQPIIDATTLEKVDYLTLRAKALYNQDEAMKIRKSHLNTAVNKLYEDFLGKPGSHESHKYLHTHYSEKEIYKLDK